MSDRPAFARFRWTLLRALRAAAHGELLHVGSACIQYGAPTFAGVVRFLVERGLAHPAPASWSRNVMLLILSPEGQETLATGESWWRSLSVCRRLFVSLTE